MEKIKKLKEFFKSEKIDGYIVSKNDEFFCEYVPSHNDRLSHITNFKGSATTFVLAFSWWAMCLPFWNTRAQCWKP